MLRNICSLVRTGDSNRRTPADECVVRGLRGGFAPWVLSKQVFANTGAEMQGLNGPWRSPGGTRTGSRDPDRAELNVPQRGEADEGGGSWARREGARRIEVLMGNLARLLIAVRSAQLGK